MNCDYGKARLDDYFDHTLNAVERAGVLSHCRRCAECRDAVAEHTEYLLRLKQFRQAAATAAPKPGNADLMPVAAREATATRRHSPWAMRAAAAVAACALGLGWYYQQAEPAAVAAADPHAVWSKVNIVIQVPADLDGARLTVSLPQGIYVQGFEGLHTLAWNTDFARGTNALELPVVIDDRTFDSTMPQYLDATLEHQGVSKSFEFLVGVDGATTL